MAKLEHERTYPDDTYDKSAYDRVYGDGTDIIRSNDKLKSRHMSIEDRARFLYDNGYVDKETISFKAVVERLEKLDMEARKKEEEKLNE